MSFALSQEGEVGVLCEGVLAVGLLTLAQAQMWRRHSKYKS